MSDCGAVFITKTNAEALQLYLELATHEKVKDHHLAYVALGFVKKEHTLHFTDCNIPMIAGQQIIITQSEDEDDVRKIYNAYKYSYDLHYLDWDNIEIYNTEKAEIQSKPVSFIKSHYDSHLAFDIYAGESTSKSMW